MVNENGIHWFRSGMRVALAAILVTFGHAEAAAPPEAPATSSGSYTVSYGSCSGCYMYWLEERVGSSGAWTAIGTGPVAFSNKAAGEYHYRAALLFLSGTYDYSVEYSDIATVVVGTNLPPVRTLTEQFDDRYIVRVGYYDSDSAPDLFIERTTGGSGLDGTIYRLILRATSSGFMPVVPSSGAVTTARSWPRAAVRVALHDVNLDGFADLLIGGIGRLPGLSGMQPQIVFAPGRVLASAPLAVRSVRNALRGLAEDLGSYLANPDYFQSNAVTTFVTVTYYDVSCQYSGYDVLWFMVTDYCYVIPVTTYVPVTDYSGFAADAIAIWQTEEEIEGGLIGRYAGYAQIEAIVEDSLGTPLGDWELKKILGEAEGMIDPALERGVELFAALAGIANAVAQDEGGGSGSNTADAVQLRGRRVIGFGPFHTALQYGTSTVSAYDDDPRALYDGTLVSQVDWPPDHPALTLQLGRAASGLAPANYWLRLLAADAGYGDDLRYDAIPSIGAGGFNSNGFVAGIVAATSGVTSVPMTNFVGGERPVPRHEFD